MPNAEVRPGSVAGPHSAFSAAGACGCAAEQRDQRCEDERDDHPWTRAEPHAVSECKPRSRRTRPVARASAVRSRRGPHPAAGMTGCSTSCACLARSEASPTGRDRRPGGRGRHRVVRVARPAARMPHVAGHEHPGSAQHARARRRQRRTRSGRRDGRARVSVGPAAPPAEQRRVRGRQQPRAARRDRAVSARPQPRHRAARRCARPPAHGHGRAPERRDDRLPARAARRHVRPRGEALVSRPRPRRSPTSRASGGSRRAPAGWPSTARRSSASARSARWTPINGAFMLVRQHGDARMSGCSTRATGCTWRISIGALLLGGRWEVLYDEQV